MVSVNSFNSATSAGLRALREIDRGMQVSQQRIATGLKVSSSSDDPFAWATANVMRSEISQANASRDALAGAATMATIASGSLGAIRELVGMMADEVAGAVGQDSAGKAAAHERIALLQDQMRQVVSSTYHDGGQWLDGSTTSVSAGGLTMDLTGVAMHTSDGTGALDRAGTAFAGASVLTLNVAMLSDSDLSKVLTDLGDTSDAVDAASSRIGSLESMFDGQSDFLATIVGINEKATAELTEADPDEEAAKIAALAVRRQYVMEMLASVRESQRNILLLFQN